MKYFIISYWIAATILTAGFQHAAHNADFSSLGHKNCRDDIGFSILWGSMPFTLPIIIALTGGAQYGWSLSCEGYNK